MQRTNLKTTGCRTGSVPFHGGNHPTRARRGRRTGSVPFHVCNHPTKSPKNQRPKRKQFHRRSQQSRRPLLQRRQYCQRDPQRDPRRLALELRLVLLLALKLVLLLLLRLLSCYPGAAAAEGRKGVKGRVRLESSFRADKAPAPRNDKHKGQTYKIFFTIALQRKSVSARCLSIVAVAKQRTLTMSRIVLAKTERFRCSCRLL